MTAGLAPLAFVYDRCAKRSKRHLDMRLAGCHAYADRNGWVLGGSWLDLGDHALGACRPQFGLLVVAVRRAAARRAVICLVHNWGRLAHDPAERIVLQQHVARAGGHVATAFAESDAASHAVLAAAGAGGDGHV